MSEKENENAISQEEFERRVQSREKGYILRLYIKGTNLPKCKKAIKNMQRICETELAGRYSLEIIDLLENPALAKDEQIVVIPTLIKQLPEPFRRIVGDLSNTDKVLVGLDLKKR